MYLPSPIYLGLSLAILTCLTACAGVFAQPPAASQPLTDSDAVGDREGMAILEHVEQRAEEIKTLVANVTYERFQGLLGDQTRRYGTLVYDRGPPALFAVDFDKLVHGDTLELDSLRYIFDGRWLAERNDNDRIFRRYELVSEEDAAAGLGRDLLKLGEGPFPLPLNLRKGRVLQRFKVNRIGPADELDRPSVGLRLTPKSHAAEVEDTLIHLWFDACTYLPLCMQAVNEDEESETIIILRNLQVDIELEADLFDTTPPDDEGWQVQIDRIELDRTEPGASPRPMVP